MLFSPCRRILRYMHFDDSAEAGDIPSIACGDNLRITPQNPFSDFWIPFGL
jgi:hypothetical protein